MQTDLANWIMMQNYNVAEISTGTSKNAHLYNGIHIFEYLGLTSTLNYIAPSASAIVQQFLTGKKM